MLEVYRGLQTIGGSITYGEGVYNTLHDETIWKRYEEAVMHDADNIVSDVIVQMIIPNGLLDSQESRRYEADASVSLSDISGRMIVSEIIFRVIRTLRMIDSFDSVNVRRTLGDDAERMSDRLKREVSEYLSYAGISDLGVDDLMKIYAGGNLIGNEDIFRIADGMFDRWLRIHMGEGQTLQEAMVPYVDRFKIYNSSFELESDEESVKQVEEGLRRFMAEGTYLTDTGFSYASPAALRDKEAQPGQGIGGRVFGDAASIATKEISARPLTKEYAEKHAEELLLLHHLIHGQAWTKEQLLADVWEKGKFGMAEDRPFKGKWKHSRVAIDSSGKPVGLLIAYERPAGEMGGVEGEPVYVHAIAVDPGYQRRNIGRDLMLDLVKNIVPGNAPIALQTGMDNVPAQNFYRNLGFKEVGRKEYPATTQDAAHTDLVLAASVKDVMYAADPDGAVIQSIPETAEPVVAEESPEELEAREFIEADPDFVAAIAPYQYLTDLYGYRPFLDLFEAAGELPKVFFKYSMSNLEEAFLGKGLKLEDFWPDIIDLVRHVSSTGDEKDVQYMISRGIPDLVSVFTAEEFKKFWPGLVELGKALPGPNAGFLFHDYIPMMVKPFSSKELEEYWPDLVRLGKEAEPNAGYLLGYAIPALSNIITTREELNSIGNDLIRLDKAAGNRAEYLFRTGIPELRETFKDKLKEYWPGLVRMGVAAGPAAKSLYYDGISKIESGERAIWRFFPSKKFDEYWPGLVETAVEAGPGAAYLFMVVLPALARDEYLETNWESLAGEAGKRPVAEAAAVLFAEDYKDGIDWVDRLTEFQDDVRTMYLVLKLLDDKTELHLRHLLFTRRYAEIRKMIESGEVTPVEVAGLSLEARMADIAAYSTERMLSGAHEGKVDMFGNFILLPGLTPLDEKINVKAVTKEELLKELSDCGIEGAEAALREAIAKEGMTLEKTAAGEAIVPIVLDTALSAYRGSRETDGIYANYLTHAITTAIFKYAKIGGENANYIGEDAAQAASGDKAAHEFDINMMNLSGISGREVDTAVSLAFSYGRKTRLPEYARKRTVNIYAYTFSGHIRELMRYQMTERRAKQNIRQIFEWLSSGVLDETQLVNAIEALKTELAVLDPWSGTCGLNDDYFDA
ncbi:MAG TPA: GNAT family N-acetyltransferase, partial [Candidatus Omnitrophota bacterium]|nr:GNAT family N-acetyltransferase [Candidatus Omnitrophota bacterium]